MSLKAKLEAVIYAAEEPVTLTQLAQLFAADALEWQAAQQAAAREANAEMAGEPDLPLLEEGMASLGMADTVAMTIQAGEQAADAAVTADVGAAGEGAPDTGSTGEADPSSSEPPVDNAEFAPAAEAEAAPAGAPALEEESAAEPVDAEAEARRLARQREREIKAILKQILDEIIATYAADDHGVEIREIAGGYRMATKPECHDAVRLFVKSLKPPLKLSLPALETLAVVAYRQPVTAPEVSEIRGVESGGVLGSLLARKLIATAGRKQVIGRPILYKTTKEFLLRFGLKDLNELPSMEEFEKMAAAEIEEMEPEAVAADAAEEAAEAALAEAEASEPNPESSLEPPDAGQSYAEAEADPARPTEPAAPDASSGHPAPESEDLESNSPSGRELAETEPAPPCPPESTQASQPSAESPTDATSAEPSPTSNEQDAAIQSSDAPQAEPEPPAPAENEAHPHAQEVEESHGA